MWLKCVRLSVKVSGAQMSLQFTQESQTFFFLFFLFFFLIFLFFYFSRQGFSVALEPVLELALVDQAGLELTKIHLPLPPECWD